MRFVFPTIHDNPSGWGPCSVPEQFRDTPYQPFSKDDRLGKVTKILQMKNGGEGPRFSTPSLSTHALVLL